MIARVRRSRWRTAFVVLAVLAVSQHVFDGAMRHASQAVAAEWWNCLLRGTPPALHHELVEGANPRLDPPGQTPAVDLEELPALSPRQLFTPVSTALTAPDGGLTKVKIAVVDSGLQGSHPDLDADRVLAGIDVINPCGDGRTDVTGHGTAVAGVISSVSHGVAPQVQILPVRSSFSTNTGLRWLSAAGIVWATDQGADIISLSRTSVSTTPSRVEHAAVRYAARRGVVMVASAGNDPLSPARYPAAYPEVISVTSVDGSGRLSAFAARSGHIDLAAPGSHIQTLALGGDFRAASGTSLSAPFVAGLAARLLATHPGLSPAQLREILVATARPLPEEATRQADAPFGIVDFEAAAHAAAALTESRE